MKTQTFNYDDVCMGVRKEKPKTYFRSFKEDYRLRSLKKTILLGKGKMLDIGCGGGMLTESLPYYYPKMDIYGCDISRTAISYAKKIGSGNVGYALIKSKKLPYKDNFFDVCICFDVLEHIPDVHFFFREVTRVLKKNGRLFLIVPCEGQPFTYTWFFQKIRLGDKLTYKQFGHIHPEFTYKYVSNLLSKHNFEVLEKAYSEHLFYQLTHLLIFSLPKILSEYILGVKKASEYTNSSLVKSPKQKNDPLFIIRNIWYFFFDLMMFYPMNWETIILRRFPIGAWKLHVLAQVR